MEKGANIRIPDIPIFLTHRPPELSGLQGTQYISCHEFRRHNTIAVRTSGNTIPQLSGLQGTQYHSFQNFRGHYTTDVRTSG
jgi:hypothetical protein